MPVPLLNRPTRSSATWGRAGAALVLVGAIAVTPAATSAPESAASAATAVRQGTLMSAVDRTKSESNAGIKQAMVEVGWDWVQPKSATAWNTAGLKEVRADVLAHRAAGRRVTLGFAVHETPAWAFTLPDARSIDNHGAKSGDLNVVFSQSVRNATAAYMRKVLAAVGPANIDRIRITSGGSYELLYPGESYSSYGRITAAGMPAQPKTGRPGTRSTKAQHHAWARWYVGGLANVANWQMSVANAAGFKGTYEILMPGSGVRPSAWSAATSRHLPDGLLGLGAAWYQIAPMLANKSRVNLHQSGVGDRSGSPSDNGCRSTDSATALGSRTADAWSSTRWVSYLAKRYGFAGVSGENPGYGDSVPTSWYRNPDGLAKSANTLARSCGFTVFYWAHSHRLWDGTLPIAKYATAAR